MRKKICKDAADYKPVILLISDHSSSSETQLVASMVIIKQMVHKILSG